MSARVEACTTAGGGLAEVDFHCVENNINHNTHEISMDHLIVRRGQSFLLTVKTSHMTFDSMELTVETGPEPSEALGTMSVFKVNGKHLTKKSWEAKLQESTSASAILAITSPADAPIGKYSLSLKSSSSLVNHGVGSFIVLFNPWCAEDWVYLPQQNEREEYVMNEYGALYTGSNSNIFRVPWDFGQSWVSPILYFALKSMGLINLGAIAQTLGAGAELLLAPLVFNPCSHFEDDTVDICLKLLDMNLKCLRNAREDFSARCNPIYVSRVVSAMINANDDRGVLIGKWDEDGNYHDGVPPTRWNDSMLILRQWFQNGCHPVKYGQCWVFAAVMCTVLRCLGIPCRVVTNYESAHDTDGNLTIDEYVDEDYCVRPKKTHDRIWNFHVWVEAWMRRPDLSENSVYDGWQVLDPTPQERSDGVHCCGPAPVKAVLEGHTGLKYDAAFIFAEVNADRITWVVAPDGSKRKVSSDTQSVGQNISTKAVGSYNRVDLTASYKYREGTWKERDVFKSAVDRCSADKNRDSGTCPKNMSMTIEELRQSINSKDLNFNLKMRSDLTVSQELLIHVNIQPMTYKGVPGTLISRTETKELLQPYKELNIPIKIPFSKYGEHMVRYNSLKVIAIAREMRNGEMYMTQRNIVPDIPTLTIAVTGSSMQHREMTADVLFENPLPVTLKDCSLTLTGSGLLRQPEKSQFPSLDPGTRVRMRVTFTPYRAGQRTLVADFDCNLLRDLKASHSVAVEPEISTTHVYGSGLRALPLSHSECSFESC